MLTIVTASRADLARSKTILQQPIVLTSLAKLVFDLAYGVPSIRDEDGLKQPYYITPCDQFGFAFAGVWESWQGQGRIIESCAIITKAAPLQMRQIHSRVPLSLSSKEILDWLSNSTSTRKLDSILQTDTKMNLRATPVSRLVNSSRIKDERCLEAVGEPNILQ